MGALILLSWPETLIRCAGTWYFDALGALGLLDDGGLRRLQHGGLLLVSRRTGAVHYFDCGRYHCPPGTARVRDAESDPELDMGVRARFGADGTLENLDELLAAAARNPWTHGEGGMAASVLHGIDFEGAFAAAKGLQERGLLPYGYIAPWRMNCSRFLARTARAGHPHPGAGLALAVLEAVNCTPLVLVRAVRDEGDAYYVLDGRVERRPRWSLFMSGRPRRRPTPDEVRGVGSMVTPPRPDGLPAAARWLAGTAFGGWFALTREPGLKAHELRFRRWAPRGRPECDRVFAPADGAVFDAGSDFDLLYPTHGRLCTVRQAGRVARLLFAREFAPA